MGGHLHLGLGLLELCEQGEEVCGAEALGRGEVKSILTDRSMKDPVWCGCGRLRARAACWPV